MHCALFLMAGTNLQVVALAPASPEATAALAAQQAAEEKEYQRLKAELQIWCQGTALTCFVATVIFYSKVTPWLSTGVVEIMPGLSMTYICWLFSIMKWLHPDAITQRSYVAQSHGISCDVLPGSVKM